jgi:hypothetical protein
MKSESESKSSARATRSLLLLRLTMLTLLGRINLTVIMKLAQESSWKRSEQAIQAEGRSSPFLEALAWSFWMAHHRSCTSCSP